MTMHRFINNAQKRFVLFFGGIIVLGLSVIALLNVYINPWQNYGLKGSFYLYNARLAKANYLQSLPRDQLPEVIVLGSSNVMRFSPSTIEKLIGRRAFNYGVYWGRTDDFLCITSFLIKDLKIKPNLLIVGLDTWCLKTGEVDHPIFPGVRRRLLNTPQLVQHHPDISKIPLAWSKVVDMFSFQQTSISLDYFLKRRDRRTFIQLERHKGFNTDGTRNGYGDPLRKQGNIREAVDSGEYSIDVYMEKIFNTGVFERFPHFAGYNFATFWDKRINYLCELLQLCQEERIQVVFVLNPVHPIFWEVIAGNTPHLRHLENLLALLEKLKIEYPVIKGTINASRIEFFGGSRKAFYDEIHPATANCDLIIQQIAELYNRN